MITVSYNGVHQAYQLALAAQEAGLLDLFYCSFYDAPGKWGHYLSRLLGQEAMRNRRLEGLDTTRVTEHPWPELLYKLRGKFTKLPGNAWISAAWEFDRWAAKQLVRGSSQAVVCAENCAYETFRTAKQRGMKKIYDCPGHNTKLLQEATEEAARRTGLPFVSAADTTETTRRKEVEIDLADVVLTYSDFHTDGVVARGVLRERIVQIPLWTDSVFWQPPAIMRNRSGPLKVLFAGGINLRKGVPFLIEAVRALSPHARLTMVGCLDPDTKPCLAGCEDFVTVYAAVDKQTLRSVYHAHDVLVLPSLGDSFGFVALEAMACGLPVILTDNCGAPVPVSSWRVPVMNSVAIRERLNLYLEHPGALENDRVIARSFAQEFTCSRYRGALGSVLSGNQSVTTDPTYIL
jgi:glycosyltransferase involved in cell wall biosynthesis